MKTAVNLEPIDFIHSCNSEKQVSKHDKPTWRRGKPAVQNRKSAADSRNYGEGFSLSSSVQETRQRGNSCDFRRAGIHLHWTSIWLTVPGLSFANSSVFPPSSRRQSQTARCPLCSLRSRGRTRRTRRGTSRPQPPPPNPPSREPHQPTPGPTPRVPRSPRPVPNASRAAAARARLTRGELTGAR